MKDHILSVLKHTGPLGTEDLRRALEQREGRKVGRVEIRDRLISLVDAKEIFSIPKGHGFMWNLVKVE